MQQEPNIISILLRYSKNESLSTEEREILSQWLEESKANKLLFDEMSDRELWQEQVVELQKKNSRPTWEIIEERIKEQGGFKRTIPAWIKYAAAIILLAGTWGLFKWMNKNLKRSELPEKNLISKTRPDIQTGSQQAILTINGGAAVSLTARNLDSLKRSGFAGINLDTPTLYYNKKNLNGYVENNILTTPKGATFQLVLSDGTRVWMNTQSSLSYPTVFPENERKVYLKGEAYFEVTKNNEKPFLVETDQSVIRVLGTHFNVESYGGTATTLLEGSIQMRTENARVILNPGQQGTAKSRSAKISIRSVDLEKTMAWRKNNFWFTESSFPEMMETLSRWYPMRVQFEDSVRGHFTGILPRDRSLVKLLEILEGGGHVQFTIEKDLVKVKAK